MFPVSFPVPFPVYISVMHAFQKGQTYSLLKAHWSKRNKAEMSTRIIHFQVLHLDRNVWLHIGGCKRTELFVNRFGSNSSSTCSARLVESSSHIMFLSIARSNMFTNHVVRFIFVCKEFKFGSISSVR